MPSCHQQIQVLVGLNPYRLSLTFGSFGFLSKRNWAWVKSSETLSWFAPSPKEQLSRTNIRIGDIVIQACADDEQVTLHAVRNLFVGSKYYCHEVEQIRIYAIGDRKTPTNLLASRMGQQMSWLKSLTRSSGLTAGLDEGWFLYGSSLVQTRKQDRLICRNRKIPLVAKVDYSLW